MASKAPRPSTLDTSAKLEHDAVEMAAPIAQKPGTFAMQTPTTLIQQHSEREPAQEVVRRRADEGDNVQYFSEQELKREAGKAIADVGKQHTPLNNSPTAVTALEISLVAMSGLKIHPLKTSVFLLVYIGWGIAMAFGIHWYCYAYPFGSHIIDGVNQGDGLLDSTQSNLAIAGFFFVFYGASCLVMTWLPAFFCTCTTVPSPIRDASWVLLHCDDGSHDIARVRQSNVSPDVLPDAESREPQTDGTMLIRLVNFRKVRFIYSPASGDFEAETFEDPVIDGCKLGLGHTDGLKQEVHKTRKGWCGNNLINVKVPSIPALLATEVRSPVIV
jgi:hypothetical protein